MFFCYLTPFNLKLFCNLTPLNFKFFWNLTFLNLKPFFCNLTPLISSSLGSTDTIDQFYSCSESEGEPEIEPTDVDTELILDTSNSTHLAFQGK